MFAKTAVVILAAVASVVSALPSSEPPSRVESAPRAKRTTHSGLATVYDQFGAAGSCGQVHADSDFIGALTPTWQGSSWPPKYCGRKVFITNTGSGDGVGGKGNSVTIAVADTCPGCPSADSIDLSRGAFSSLTNGATTGNVNIDWHFCNTNGQC
ncbi:expansin module family protein [Trichoderma atroviride IMI 206040]|uniref:Expansin module family protein n=1 Tax=Hypocrea atroviridis (strain ATCC 20476 / IMI 206040) TaxID=452589 RepID=G9NFY4_HYPAI|nr:expansin module family protein [Trichoderma atroviride IMI 206040]EHK50196.1 expansin module family protein [Trichoderma atroviride IMI 206040]